MTGGGSGSVQRNSQIRNCFFLRVRDIIRGRDKETVQRAPAMREVRRGKAPRFGILVQAHHSAPGAPSSFHGGVLRVLPRLDGFAQTAKAGEDGMKLSVSVEL